MECPKNVEWSIIILLLACLQPSLAESQSSEPIHNRISIGSRSQDIAQLPQAEGIYRRISPGGTEIYSDRPEAPPPAPPTAPSPDIKQPGPSSLHIHITEPPTGSSVVSPVGSLKLGYRLSSPPPSDSRIRALVDGQPHREMAKGCRSRRDRLAAVNGSPCFRAAKDGSLLLEGLAPGSRRVQLQLFSGKGELLGESEPAIYYFLLPPR